MKPISAVLVLALSAYACTSPTAPHQNQPPSVGFTTVCYPSAPHVEPRCEFTPHVTDADGQVLHMHWDFGYNQGYVDDPTILPVVHYFGTGCSCLVTLEAVDNDEASVSAHIRVEAW